MTRDGERERAENKKWASFYIAITLRQISLQLLFGIVDACLDNNRTSERLIILYVCECSCLGWAKASLRYFSFVGSFQLF